MITVKYSWQYLTDMVYCHVTKLKIQFNQKYTHGNGPQISETKVVIHKNEIIPQYLGDINEILNTSYIDFILISVFL